MKRLMSFFSCHILKVLPLIGMLLLTACEETTENDLVATQQKMNSPEGCFSCQFFQVVYNTAANMSSDAYLTMCDVASSLLIIGLMFWILFHVFKLLITLREPNLAQFWVQLFQQLFKGGFVAILVASKERLYQFINTVMEPIALIFVDLSNKMLVANWSSQVSMSGTLSTNFSAGPGLPSSIGKTMEMLIYRITLALNVGRVIGLRLMLQSDMINYWLGLVTTIIFFLMTLIFPFYLIDGFIRLALVFALLPIFLVCWAFKWSAHYMTKVWDMFIGAFTQIFVACIFVSIFIAVFEGFISIRGYGYLLDPTVQNVDALFREEANRMSFSFLSFLVIAFYMYNLSKSISKVTSHFTGASSSNAVVSIIEKAKKGTRALILAGVALAGAALGLTPVAKVAAKQAKDDAKEAIGGK